MSGKHDRACLKDIKFFITICQIHFTLFIIARTSYLIIPKYAQIFDHQIYNLNLIITLFLTLPKLGKEMIKHWKNELNSQ